MTQPTPTPTPAPTVPSELKAFLGQVDALKAYLEQCLAGAGITGVQAVRCLTRLTEFSDEIAEVHSLIETLQDNLELPKVAKYAALDVSLALPGPLSARVDAGIQDLGATIQDSLVAAASLAKKELPAPTDTTLDTATASAYCTFSYACCIEEVGATVMRLAEAARYLFQTAILLKVFRSRHST